MVKSKTSEEPRWGQTYANIPPGLRAAKAIAAAKEAEAAVEANHAKKDKPVEVHNAAHRAALKSAGVKSHPANRGLTKGLNQHSTFGKGR